MNKLCATQSYKLPQLKPFIDSVSFYHNEHQSDSKSLLFEGCPEGLFELIFQSDKTVWQKDQKDGVWRQRDEAFLGGLHQQGYQLKLPPNTEIMSVRFNHGAFKYVFSGQLNDFINQKVPITDLWSHSGKQLINKLKRSDNHTDKIKVIASFLESKVNGRKHSVIDQTVLAILNCHGMIDMQALEQQSALSSAQFRKRFREEVGLPPKSFAKVIKMNAIMKQLERQQGKQLLTDVVYDFGYFDQSHFIKDFKSFIGITPTQFRT